MKELLVLVVLAGVSNAGCRERSSEHGLPPAGSWQPPAAPTTMTAAGQLEELSACVAAALVSDSARLRADAVLDEAIDGYRDAPPAVRVVGLRALARAAEGGRASGRALAKVARALAESGEGADAVTFALAALTQAEASQPTFTFERTDALAEASAALARAGAHDQLAAHPTTEPLIHAAIAAGYAQAGDRARAEAARTADGDADATDLGVALARLTADAWLGDLDRARAVVAALTADDRGVAALALARAALAAHRTDVLALVDAAATELAGHALPRDAGTDRRARDRAQRLASQPELARLRLRAGDRAGALAALDRLAASITAPSPGLYETAALSAAAQVATEAGDDARAEALLQRTSGGTLAQAHPAPAAEVDRLTRQGKFLEALDVAHGHAGMTSTFYAQVLTRAAAAGPLAPAVARRLRERVCRR